MRDNGGASLPLPGRQQLEATMLTDSPGHGRSETADCARYIGRVGSLAVALGIGAAVATGFGMGIAQADDTATSETSPSVDSPSNSPTPSAGGGQTGQPTPPDGSSPAAAGAAEG